MMKKIILALALTTWSLQMQAVGPEVDIKEMGKVEISKLTEKYNMLKNCDTDEDLCEIHLQDETGLTFLFSRIEKDFVFNAERLNFTGQIACFIKNCPKKVYLRSNGKFTVKKATTDVVFEIRYFNHGQTAAMALDNIVDMITSDIVKKSIENKDVSSLEIKKYLKEKVTSIIPMVVGNSLAPLWQSKINEIIEKIAPIFEEIYKNTTPATQVQVHEAKNAELADLIQSLARTIPAGIARRDNAPAPANDPENLNPDLERIMHVVASEAGRELIAGIAQYANNPNVANPNIAHSTAQLLAGLAHGDPAQNSTNTQNPDLDIISQRISNAFIAGIARENNTNNPIL